MKNSWSWPSPPLAGFDFVLRVFFSMKENFQRVAKLTRPGRYELRYFCSCATPEAEDVDGIISAWIPPKFLRAMAIFPPKDVLPSLSLELWWTHYRKLINSQTNFCFVCPCFSLPFSSIAHSSSQARKNPTELLKIVVQRIGFATMCTTCRLPVTKSGIHLIKVYEFVWG